ncbi:hypothetical protein BIV57_08010 [Mangrovactinospora gilvigrisea]|uniref:NB-ARC domain-containing protein n=1 Tax=Mangrovactinospora gilvigrisea TaxID=1428644 RepID=A0A1J7CEA9_9ACTN|nr:hypothetical protein BIV57_08010 [Mangrovactinospora gilvigrisea]
MVVVCAVDGMAGVGKTTLALHAAHRALDHKDWFPAGALFIDLHGYEETNRLTPDQAIQSLLHQLGVRYADLPPTPEDRAALYRSELAKLGEQSGPALLVIDNAHPASHADRLLPGRGRHRMLLTSRHRLTSPGLPGYRLAIDVLPAVDATALIVAALTAANAYDSRATDEPKALADVVQYCGGLPLALQIAAALLVATPDLTMAEMAQALEEQQSRLEVLDYRDDDGRQLAVHPAFALSLRAQPEEQQHLFGLLALNPGPDVSTEAAVALADAPSAQTRQGLNALARAHLIEAVEAGRWRFHDLLRLYAAARLCPDEPDAKAAEARVLEYYRETANVADVWLRALPGDTAPRLFDSRDQALAWMDAEVGNLVAATAHAAQVHPKTGLSLALCMSEYLNWRRRFDNWLAVGQVGLLAAQTAGDRSGEGLALNSLGIALREVRRFEEAVDACRQAAAIFREFGDRNGEGGALGNLGAALLRMRRFEEAVDACRQAVAIFQETGDRHGEGLALNSLGIALREVRRFEEAVDACRQAAAISRQFGDRHGEGGALGNLGVALLEVRRFEEAIKAHQQAATIFQETGDRYHEGLALNGLGIALREARRFEEAVDVGRQAAVIFREAGDRHGEGLALGNLGFAQVEVGRFEEAIDVGRRAAVIFREVGDRHREGIGMVCLGIALREVGRFEEAVKAHRQAAVIFREAGDRHGEGEVLSNLGAALQGVGRFEEAIDVGRQAAVIFREAGDQHREGMALSNLGGAMAGVGRFEEAVDACRQAVAIFRETGDRHGESQALDNLDIVQAKKRHVQE